MPLTMLARRSRSRSPSPRCSTPCATSRARSEWIPEILEAELLEVYEDDDLPATARFKASATVGTDRTRSPTSTPTTA